MRTASRCRSSAVLFYSVYLFPTLFIREQVGRTRDRFQAVTLGIYSVAADISMCPGVDSASKNEYQDTPGGKGGRCVRLTTLPPSCAECLVNWSINQPEPSGPHRPVIGIALPFIYNETTFSLQIPSHRTKCSSLYLVCSFDIMVAHKAHPFIPCQDLPRRKLV